MSIFDTLLKLAPGQNQQTQAPAPAPAPNVQQQQQQVPGNAPVPPTAPNNSPANPGNPQFNGATPPGTQENPLDQYNNIWNPATPPAAAPGAPAPQTQAVTFNQQEVQQRLGQMDFMRFAQQADLQAVAAGGEGAVQALGNVINGVMRQAMLMQTGFAAQSANSAADFAYNRANQGLPEMVRGQLTQNHLVSENELMSHPAMVPMIEAMRQQFQSQYPKATPAQVAAHLNGYMQAVSGAFAPKQETPANGKQNGQQQGTDWSQWMAN